MEKTFSRSARLEDFLDEDEDICIAQNKSNKNHSQNNNQNQIPKNQQEFGNRKRIKP